MFDAGLGDELGFHDDEGDYTAEQKEGAGPPHVSAGTLNCTGWSSTGWMSLSLCHLTQKNREFKDGGDNIGM